MFSMGPSELVIILVVALVVVGPEKLPELARMVGRAMRDLKKYASDVRNEFEKDLPMNEIRRDLDVLSDKTPSYDYSYGGASDTSEDDTYRYEDEESFGKHDEESGEGADRDESEEEEMKDEEDTEGRLDEEYPD